MNQSELIEKLAEKTDLPKTQVKTLLDHQAEVVAEGLKEDGEVTLPGITKIKREFKEERQARNPATGGTVTVAAHHKPAFKPTKPFKDSIQA